MFHKIGGLISLLSAMLCVGVIVLAVRSRQQTDLFVMELPGRHTAGIASDHWALLFVQSDLSIHDFADTDLDFHSFAVYSMSIDAFKSLHDTILDPATTIKFSFLGFQTAAGKGTMAGQITAHFSAIRLPCWFLAIILAVLPIGVGRAALTRFQRRRKGLCLNCGYDLRFSEGRCPECGTSIPMNASSSDVGAGVKMS